MTVGEGDGAPIVADNEGPVLVEVIGDDDDGDDDDSNEEAGDDPDVVVEESSACMPPWATSELTAATAAVAA